MVVVLYALAYGPILYNYTHPIPGRTYLGYIVYPIDTLGNLISVERGFAGEWLKYSYVTTAIPSQGFFVKTEYLLTGHIARILGISPLYAFRAGQIVLSISLLLFLWFLVGRVFRSVQAKLLSWGLILFSAGITLPGSQRGWEKIRSDMEVFQRLTVLQPHYLIGALFSLISLYCISTALSTRRQRYFWIAAVSGMVATHVFAPAMIIIVAGLPVYLVLRIVLRQASRAVSDLPKLFAYSVLTLLPVLYLYYISQFYDWNRLPVAEALFGTSFTVTDYVLLIGGITVFAIISIPRVLRSGTFLLLVLSYCISHAVMVTTGARVLHFNPLRFIQTPYFVAYAILGAVGIQSFIGLLRRFFPRIARIAVLLLSILIILVPSWYTYKLSFTYFLERSPYENLLDLGYPKITDVSAMQWLAAHGVAGSITLTGMTNGTLILSLTPLRVYASTWFGALQLGAEGDAILYRMFDFYRGDMSEAEAAEFLHKNNIRYVYYGKDEQSLRLSAGQGSALLYNYLIPVYRNPDVTIFRVN